jgi:hypothetical protein
VGGPDGYKENIQKTSGGSSVITRKVGGRAGALQVVMVALWPPTLSVPSRRSDETHGESKKWLS